MRSIRLEHSARIAVDTYELYMFWAVVVLAISLVVRGAVFVFTDDVGMIEVNADSLLRGFSQVFALVVGIVNGVYAVRYFVRQGVTRRSFFLGGVLAGIAIAVSLQVIALMLVVGASLLEQTLPLQIVADGSGLLVSSLMRITITFSFFVMGWIIGFSFCRFKALGGFAAVLAGLIVMGVLVSIWGEGVYVSIMGLTIPPIDGLSLGLSFAATVVVLAGQLVTLYLFVRNAPLAVQ